MVEILKSLSSKLEKVKETIRVKREAYRKEQAELDTIITFEFGECRERGRIGSLDVVETIDPRNGERELTILKQSVCNTGNEYCPNTVTLYFDILNNTLIGEMVTMKPINMYTFRSIFPYEYLRDKNFTLTREDIKERFDIKLGKSRVLQK